MESCRATRRSSTVARGFRRKRAIVILVTANEPKIGTIRRVREHERESEYSQR